MQKPDANLNPDSQPWSRYVEQQQAEGVSTDAALAARIDTLITTVNAQAAQMAVMQTMLDRVDFELVSLYTNTGNPYPPGGGTPTPPPVPTYGVEEVVADWSRTWGSSSYYTGSDTHTNGTFLYQGSNPENKIGMWHFPLAASIGKTITDVQMFIQNIDSPYSAGFTAGFGTHGNASAPVGKPGRQNGFDIGWGRGGGSWIGIPSWAWGSISSGAIQGFTIGGIGASDANYAYFQGVGQPNPPRLKVTYQA